MQQFNEWLDTYVANNQINLNDVLNFKDMKTGEKRHNSLGEIFNFVKSQSEKVQESFQNSLIEGAKKNNIIGYIWNASKWLKVDNKSKENTAQENQESTKNNSQSTNSNDGKNWFKAQEATKEEVAERLNKLEADIKKPETAINAVKEFQEYIKQFGNLYQYSLNNTLLIISQAKKMGIDPAIIKSEKDWKKLDVEIKKTKPIYIYVPQENLVWQKETITDENGDKKSIFKLDEEGKKIPELDNKGNQKKTTYFSLSGKVYDVTQTNGYEIGMFNKMDQNRDLQGKIKYDDKFLNMVKEEVSHNLNVTIIQRPIQNGSLGYYTKKDGEHQIHIDNNRSVESQLTTLLHEVGHFILHSNELKEKYNGNEKTKSTAAKELEAESFSYVMSQKFGLEAKSAEYLLPYLQKTELSLKESFEDIYKAIKIFESKVDIDTMINSQLANQKLGDSIEKIKKVDYSAMEEIKKSSQETHQNYTRKNRPQ